MYMNTHMYEAHAHRHAHFTLLHLPSSITTLFLSPSTTVLVDSFSSVTVDFAVLFVMPVMGRMSDQDTSVRLAASMCFAQLIPLAALQVILSHTPLWASARGHAWGAGDSSHGLRHTYLASCTVEFVTGGCIVRTYIVWLYYNCKQCVKACA